MSDAVPTFSAQKESIDMQLKITSSNLKKAVWASFDPKTIYKGKKYQEDGRVEGFKIRNDLAIIGEVQGSQEPVYEVDVKINNSGSLYSIDATCSCSVGYNCKHAAALLLEILEQNGPSEISDQQREYDGSPETRDIQLDYHTHLWLERLFVSADKNNETENIRTDHLVFILNVAENHPAPDLEIHVQRARLLKNGNLGKLTHFHLGKSATVCKKDLELYARLNTFAKTSSTYEGIFYFQSNSIDNLLSDLVKTKRCYWKTTDSDPLTLAHTKKVNFVWKAEEGGLQKVHCNLQAPYFALLPLKPLWYVDTRDHQIGPVETAVSDSVALALLHGPALNPFQAKKTRELIIEKNIPEAALPLPETFEKTVEEMIQPVPCVYLFCKSLKNLAGTAESAECEYALGRILFRYGNTTIAFAENHHKTVYSLKNEVLTQTKRNKVKEESFLHEIQKLSIKFISERDMLYRLNYRVPHIKNTFMIDKTNDPEAILNFVQAKMNTLKEKGWEIRFDDYFPFRSLEEPEDWYSSVTGDEMQEWFNLELGVIIDGKRINLLSPLLKLIREKGLFQQDLRIDPDKKFVVDVGKGRFLAVPYSRLQPALNVLRELYAIKELDNEKVLKISRAQAALLVEMEKAFGAAQLRWFGERTLLDLGKKLENFSGIQVVELPKNFHATLRPYQQEGVNWLQFLREYHLNAILADDMGLGKTVQTLAHILIEKEAGRLTKPCLIIAPTSVIPNWKMEAERFAPSLRVLLLHGQNRKEYFSDMLDHDLILTTYPLLVRDTEILLAQEFYLIILDEAQYIKNAHAKSTQIVQQLSGRYRLCLTGTPLENHLGELWSLFHFLVPGLLGNLTDFNQRFRFPIEKNGDVDCQDRLAKRVKPFILRRTKNEVVQDLPEKTEMIRHVQLEGKQRDLYESIRLAMHDKVKKAIEENGIEKSQIIILDALLKLRQVCCDPRLLKMDAAEKVDESAKLQSLMEMLPELLEEGRRILLFSQFTSMLSLIEIELKKSNINYIKLTGQTQDRLSLIQRFQNLEVPLFLISLKAGGTGLNLTAADTVIHYDPWWNPSAENQATDRAHRIGQEKPVFVYKFVAVGTVEEKILAMQHRKKALADAIFSAKSESGAMVSREDFEALFI